MILNFKFLSNPKHACRCLSADTLNLLSRVGAHDSTDQLRVVWDRLLEYGRHLPLFELGLELAPDSLNGIVLGAVRNVEDRFDLVLLKKLGDLLAVVHATVVHEEDEGA